MIYKSKVGEDVIIDSADGVEHYTGLTGGSFKDRYSKHNSDINLSKAATTLSSHVLKLKEEGKPGTSWTGPLSLALSVGSVGFA